MLEKQKKENLPDEAAHAAAYVAAMQHQHLQPDTDGRRGGLFGKQNKDQDQSTRARLAAAPFVFVRSHLHLSSFSLSVHSCRPRPSADPEKLIRSTCLLVVFRSQQPFRHCDCS